jgi:hypothetical protein
MEWNPWLGGYRPQIAFHTVLFPHRNVYTAPLQYRITAKFRDPWKINPYQPNKNTGFTHLKIEWNPWLGGYNPQISVLCALSRQLNLLNSPPPPEKNSWRNPPPEKKAWVWHWLTETSLWRPHLYTTCRTTSKISIYMHSNLKALNWLSISVLYWFASPQTWGLFSSMEHKPGVRLDNVIRFVKRATVRFT